MKKFKCFVVFLVFFSLTFAVFGAGNGKNKSTLVSNSANETVVTFNLDSYDFERVVTPQGEELVLKAPHAGRILKQGAPDLVKFSTAVIIPDQGKMAIEVIDGQYTEMDKVRIAPSKGNLFRDQDPSLVPYKYGKEYKKDAFFPGTLAELNDPYIARDFRGQAVILYPFQYNPVTGTLRVYSSLTVKVYKKGNAGENQLNRNKPLRLDEIVHEFKNVYSRHFINYDAMTQAEGISSLQYTPLQDPIGRMLIVCYSGFMSNMANFVSYKQSIGYTVDLVDYSTIGSAAALKTYVANYYNTNGLTYLLIVGDNAQVPVSSTTAGDSDSDYGFIVGSDHYLDIFVGRFSAETTAHVDTQVNRTIWYERDLSSSATWFRHTTGMGTSEGPGHNNEYDYQHANNLLTDLANYGYTTHTNHQSDGSTANLSSLINSGQGTIWYCGHGNIDGWYCGWTFLNANVTALTNTGMLPAVFSVACQVGNFKTNTCFCEYWQRSTSGGNAIGSVAHCGSTINQSWIPPMDAQDEMVDLLVSASGPKRTFGGVFVNGMFKMNDLNGTGGYDMTDTWVCFGDSSVQLRTPGTPDGPGGGSGPTPPIANFSASTTSVTVGGTVTFTDTSTGSPTSWSWTFEGGTPSTSTAQNPTVTYNTIGTYDVTLVATNAQGSDTEAKTDYINAAEQSYCASQGTTYSYEWIARVQVGSLNNASGAAGYTDFTSINTNLTGGSNASVTLTPGFASSSYTEYWKIWIDYNGDHDFADTGEEEFSGSGTSAVSGSFAVNTGINITTRMRVSMKYNAAPTSCETFSYGEVEDYTVTISSGTTQPPVAAFTASATTVTVGGSVTFTDQSTNSPTSWSWSFPGGTPSTSTAQNPTITYNTAGAYNVSLTASNAAGSDDEVKTNYITVTPVSGDDIAEGVDYTATFTKSGSANWAKVTDVYYYGSDSAKSGVITHSQSTTIETSITVTSSKDVKFYWKVSSESGYDFLTFYIDGVQKNQISGTVDWTQVSNTIATGTHTLKWTYSKDASVSSGSDCGWVDKLELVTPSADPIAEAVDYTGLTFTLTGNANWYSQTTTTYYGGDAAQSGLITHSQSSSMETTISGKTSVKFYWRVSSESGYDYLRFYIDGALQTSISGSPSWAQKTYTVTTGSHVLKWTYVKDSSVSSGSDCGWVDKLELN